MHGVDEDALIGSFRAVPAPGHGWQSARLTAAVTAWVLLAAGGMAAGWMLDGRADHRLLMRAQVPLALCWLIGVFATASFYGRAAPLQVTADELRFSHLRLSRAGLTVRPDGTDDDAVVIVSPAGSWRLLGVRRPVFWPRWRADAYLPLQTLADLKRALAAPATAALPMRVPLIRNARRLAPIWFGSGTMIFLVGAGVFVGLAAAASRAAAPFATGAALCLALFSFSMAVVVSAVGAGWPPLPRRQLVLDGDEVRFEDVYSARVLARGSREGLSVERRRWRGWDYRYRAARIVKWTGLLVTFPDGNRLPIGFVDRAASEDLASIAAPAWTVVPGISDTRLRNWLSGPL